MVEQVRRRGPNAGKTEADQGIKLPTPRFRRPPGIKTKVVATPGPNKKTARAAGEHRPGSKRRRPVSETSQPSDFDGIAADTAGIADDIPEGFDGVEGESDPKADANGRRAYHRKPGVCPGPQPESLNVSQKKFVDEFALTNDPHLSYLRAGYTAIGNQQIYKLMALPKIKKALVRAQIKKAEWIQIEEWDGRSHRAWSKLSEELTRDVEMSLSLGYSHADAATMAGVSEVVFMDWLRIGREDNDNDRPMTREAKFFRRATKAKLFGSRERSSVIQGIGRGEYTGQTYIQRRTRMNHLGAEIQRTIKRIQPDWKALAWLQERIDPERFFIFPGKDRDDKNPEDIASAIADAMNKLFENEMAEPPEPETEGELEGNDD